MSQEITIETVFDAPANHVWRAWTDPAWMTWFGSDPKGWVVSAEADARVGGRFKVKFRNSDQSEFVCHRIFFTVGRWSCDPDALLPRQPLGRFGA